MSKYLNETHTLLTLCCLGLMFTLLSVQQVSGDQIPLATILPKLQAIHEDTKMLLIKNTELKGKILIGLQAQNEAKLKEARLRPQISQKKPTPTTPQPFVPNNRPALIPKPNEADDQIDYAELQEFNQWVETNLEYAVKNTEATSEALQEEAQLNNGNVDYSEQAITDGVEGVKYWQSAVIFQDKTLKNEKFEPTD